MTFTVHWFLTLDSKGTNKRALTKMPISQVTNVWEGKKFDMKILKHIVCERYIQ